MAGITEQAKTSVPTLTDITRREVELYAGYSTVAKTFAVLDDSSKTYAAIILDPKDRPAYVVVMARVVGDYVVIEEDSTLDKPLVDALMVNGSVPREKIILAYKGETLPESDAAPDTANPPAATP
jgi:hypothetical protein